MSAPSISTANRPDKPKKLMDQVRDVLRLKHYSLRTERSYCDWIERFIRFHHLRHPKEMGEVEVSLFLTQLARDGRVAAATQNQHVKASFTCQEQNRFRECITSTCCAQQLMTDFILAIRRIYESDSGYSFATSYRAPWKLIYYEAYLEQADALVQCNIESETS